jgi:hypothetical protein
MKVSEGRDEDGMELTVHPPRRLYVLGLLTCLSQPSESIQVGG